MSDAHFRPRPAQERILAYQGGRMGVSAVPGAGKTHILAILAARLVEQALGDDQEVLIVTLVNSAVENIKRRIAEFTTSSGLLRNMGYRVRTLHGLAHDIVRERPGLVGLADDFGIVDEREAQQICENAAEVWARSHPDAAEDLLSEDLSPGQREWLAQTPWTEAVNSVAAVFIKRAKDLSLTPEDILPRLDAVAEDMSASLPGGLSLAHMATQIYWDYEKSLHYRGGVDFDDLIRLASLALDRDAELLARLRYRWPFILEDEAQDSSALQERILGQLVGPTGNWVRVGDPNQAINTTFTTADPSHLRRFLADPGTTRLPMDSSGRSQPCIIDLANYLVLWTMQAHPEHRVRPALTEPFIQPTPPDDPQPNPPSDPSAIYLHDREFSPDAEIKAVVQSLARWVPEHPDATVAVLVPRNRRGFEVTDALKRAGIPFVELLQSTASTRKTAGVLGNVLQYLTNPSSAPLLARVFEVWLRDSEDRAEVARVKHLSSLIRRCHNVEEYLWPRPGRDWLDEIVWAAETVVEPVPRAAELRPAAQEGNTSLTSGGNHLSDGLAGHDPQVAAGGLSAQTRYAPTVSDRALLQAFSGLVRRWQGATILPIDQLLLTVAQDLFTESRELALSHKLAVTLRSVSESNPDWRLPELTTELAVIARNQRRFLGFDAEDTGFVPEPGTVTVSTLHKAKGLEWDRVYVLSANNYDFPSAQPYDEYISERWFVRDRLNLEAEALEQLECLRSGTNYVEGRATVQARLAYVAERLRLLYVGITRARKELVLTWNTGRSPEPKQMAVPFIALHTWWQQRLAAH